MDAWGKDKGAGDDVMMLADGNADFARAMGLEMDGKGIGFGTRSQRYSAIIDNGVIKALNVEKPMKFECSTADAILDQL
jgi:peroxiredoxin